MARLRRSSPADPGWSRRRAGSGFVYLDHGGTRLRVEDAERVKGLVIPPAWRDVWICPWPNGHLQAVGTDDAGRRQYLYHPDWRLRRDAAKHAHVLEFARVLSRARERVLSDLGAAGMSRERACATAVRLLDLGCFRIGNDVYADQNGSFGLTTLQRRHVRKRGSSLVFDFVGKSGVRHEVRIDDPPTVVALDVMRARRAPAEVELLAWKERGRWHDLTASHVNDYVRDAAGVDATAKDFRTWHATVLAAASLASSEEPGRSKASKRRAVVAAMKEVAEFLGNTPALARSSYVDPRVVDAYEEGRTIRAACRRKVASPDERQAVLERAVLRLLRTA
ncbi:MAG TPA: DNA topoisomerase IB [Nocardioides sp.]|uniref:DNA topoisomerase IB n=1 Tax=Nocardioides sp. TaxID=35761 RepID=UPI002E37A042|nr:DNA topoisomerase IB [Nocardioides sp.]HEX3929693.1 DNA topoisomerase IB [Nocardioides sp.]